ncbi:hypothetical protein [Thalassotalea aquiviva]|uniref:hypothetical protein n=1 Tax=Thalassotalea aquiviva TaxID=3242415 RepID=UPI003529ED17
MPKKLHLLAPALLIGALTACEKAPEQQTEQNTQQAAVSTLPENHPPMPTQSTEQQLGALQGGVIKDIKTGGGYTYVLVARAGQEFWAAGPETSLEVGNLVGWHNGTVMRNFTSKTLNQTFPEISFVSQFVNPSTQMTTSTQRRTSAPSASNSTGGVISEVLAGGGYTYVKVNIQGNDVWAAGPMVSAKVGDAISWQGGSKMSNFTSSSLNRTFDEIYFVGGFIKGTPNQATASTSGQVAQVIASAGYSYIEVAMSTGNVWLAAPQTSVQSGDTISWQDGAVMKNFKSSSLDKTFEQIIFVDKISKS